MPNITTPLVGHHAVIGDPASFTTVRSRPSPKSDAVVRSFPKGQTESWTILGWAKGEPSPFGNSDQWLVRLTDSGAFEYTAKGNVREVRPPAADLSDRLSKAEARAEAAEATVELDKQDAQRILDR